MNIDDINNEKMPKSVILYGAGNNAKLAYRHVQSMGKNPVCFADSDINKHSNGLPSCHYFDLPVMDIEYILNTYPNCEIYVTPNPPVKFEIIDLLIKTYQVAKERIINYEPYFKHRVCESLLNTIVFNSNRISLCCHLDIAEEQTTQTPFFVFSGLTAEQMLESFLKLRKETIESLNNNGELCKGCPKAGLMYSGTSSTDKAQINEGNFIRNAVFATGFICQIHCVYCTHSQQPLDEQLIDLDKVLDFWRFLKSENIVNDDVVVNIANGEATINPCFNDIMENFSNNPCIISTNGLVYKDEIAEKLSDGVSGLSVSLDSGTIETYKRVKGVDAFETVCNNVKRYSEYGNIYLKYILIPNLNDEVVDIDNFIKFAKDINAVVYLSRDVLGVKNFDMNIDKVINAVIYFLKCAKQAGLTVHVLEEYKMGQHKDRLSEVLNG